MIIWLASYPKSGNTLLRSILISLFFTEDGDFNLKLITKINQFETDNLIYRNKNIFKNDYSKINDISTFYKYILQLQEKQVLKIDTDFQFFKTHSGNFISLKITFSGEFGIEELATKATPKEAFTSPKKTLG